MNKAVLLLRLDIMTGAVKNSLGYHMGKSTNLILNKTGPLTPD